MERWVDEATCMVNEVRIQEMTVLLADKVHKQEPQCCVNGYVSLSHNHCSCSLSSSGRADTTSFTV